MWIKLSAIGFRPMKKGNYMIVPKGIYYVEQTQRGRSVQKHFWTWSCSVLFVSVCYTIPSGTLTLLLNMTLNSELSQQKCDFPSFCWFSRVHVFWHCKRVHDHVYAYLCFPHFVLYEISHGVYVTKNHWELLTGIPSSVQVPVKLGESRNPLKYVWGFNKLYLPSGVIKHGALENEPFISDVPIKTNLHS